MAADPRRFTVKNCLLSQNIKKDEAKNRKDFFGSLGKAGDIEVLNRFGAGEITLGLRSLSKISDSIRTGDTNSAIISNNVGYVFNAVGINQNAAEDAGKFNPGVLNRATGQAQSVLDSVRSGSFDLADIPNVITDFQNLGLLIDGIFTDGSGQKSTKNLEVCGASPYAIDLIRYAPKYKFLFVVQVTLSPEYESLNHTGKHLAYVVKTSTRPNVSIEHEEINMYNFWTRIPKRTIYEPITMRFYDDNKGNAHMFYTSYLRSMSPISRVGGMGKAGVLSVPWLEANSMRFNSVDTISTASLSALEGKNASIITEIRLFHIYDYGKFMNVYHFHHPKILTMNLDDLDVADNGGGNEIELQFAYDALHITPAFSVIANPNRLTEMTGDTTSLYPIKPNFNGPKTEEEYLQGVNDDDGALEPNRTNILEDVTTAIASGISSSISSATGLVSNAFDKAATFGGSLFN